MRVLTRVAFLVAALTLTGCGTDGAETTAAANVEDTLAGAQGQLEDLLDSGALGSGSGVITIDGTDYSFEANVCYNSPSGFEASGPGETADGVPYWATLSTGISTREEMAEAGLPAANIDAFFGDADSIEGFTLEIELGKSDAFGSGDDSMAEFSIDAFNIATSDNVSYTVNGTSITGSGSVTDYNGVALDYNETAPATFSAACS